MSWLPAAADMDANTDRVCARRVLSTMIDIGVNVVARSFDAKSRGLMVTGTLLTLVLNFTSYQNHVWN